MSITDLAVKKSPIHFGNAGVQLSTFEDAYRFSTAVAQSGWAPKGMEKPESILVAIQFGLEIGLSPMAALQNTAVINGRPGIYGDAALALVRSSGVCSHYKEADTNDECDAIFRALQFAIKRGDEKKTEELNEKLAVTQSKLRVDADDFGVSCATIREGGELDFGRFTVADAKTAGLWKKQGPWTQYPRRMLKFRARGFFLRDIYGDVLKGLRTTEELQDIPVERNVTPGRDSGGLAALISGSSTEQQSVGSVNEDTVAQQQTIQEQPIDREALISELKELMLNHEVPESRLWKYAQDGNHVPDGIDELWTLPTAVLSKLRSAVAALSAKKGGK